MPWWSRPPTSGATDDATLFNLALDVVCDWGPRMTVDPVLRLGERVRDLPAERASHAVAEAQRARRYAASWMWEHSDGAGAEARFAPQRGMTEALRTAAPWVDDANAGRLYNQCCYEVWHG